MLVTRTPLRISFVGGGSDMESFYKHSLGSVISCSINKYIYLSINKKFGGGIRVSYSKTEIKKNIDQIEHPIVKACLNKCKVKNSIEIASLADVPSMGSGLGSSSAFTVGLLNGLYAYLGIRKNSKEIAEEACEIEIKDCNEPIGKQDQYGTAIGGLKQLSFLENGEVSINKLNLTKQRLDHLQENLLILFTGKTRSASEILAKQTKALNENKSKRKIMQEMVNLAFDFQRELLIGDLNNLGTILHENWIRKSSICNSISNPWINDAYQIAINNGALGGKILGAGSGGFFLFYAHPENHGNIINNLPKMEKFNFNLEETGTQLVYSDFNT